MELLVEKGLLTEKEVEEVFELAHADSDDPIPILPDS